MVHYLRIAVTALSLTACVLLVALWVRSYWHSDSLTKVNDNFVLSRIGAGYGTFFVGSFADLTTSLPRVHGWEYQEYDGAPQRPKATWMFISNADDFLVVVPAWFVILILLTCGFAPWLRWRFTLHTFLIATTLVAVALGIVVAAM